MNRSIIPLTLLLLGCRGASAQQPPLAPEPGERHLRNIRQLTFGGNNAEAYFSPDGRRLIFQRQEQRRQPAATSSTSMNVDGSGHAPGLQRQGPHHLRLLLRRRPPHPLQLHLRALAATARRRPTARRATSGRSARFEIYTASADGSRSAPAHPERRLRRRGHRVARREAGGVHQHPRRRHRALHDERGRERRPAGDPAGGLRRRGVLLA